MPNLSSSPPSGQQSNINIQLKVNPKKSVSKYAATRAEAWFGIPRDGFVLGPPAAAIARKARFRSSRKEEEEEAAEDDLRYSTASSATLRAGEMLLWFGGTRNLRACCLPFCAFVES